MIKRIYRIVLKTLKTIKRMVYTIEVRFTAQKVGYGLRVNGKTKVTSKTTMGNNVNFNGMSILGGGEISIGNNFHSGPECMMITSFHNYEGNEIPYDNTMIDKNIIIDDNVWLGSRVIILGGVHIHEGAIIQAGSTVVWDIPPYGIAGGHPAKVFKQRNIDHYEELKKQKRFH